MTRGKQKIEAQRKNAERNQKPKGSQLDARAAAFKIVCSICKVYSNLGFHFTTKFYVHSIIPFCYKRGTIIFIQNFRDRESSGILFLNSAT